MENIINVLIEYRSVLEKMESIGYIGFLMREPIRYHFNYKEFVKLAKELNITLQFAKYIGSDDLYISTISIEGFEIYALFFENEKKRYEVAI